MSEDNLQTSNGVDTCLFCNIANREIPADITEYEQKTIISVPDIHPKTPGHTLVIPAKHARWFDEMDDDAFLMLMKVSKHIAQKLKKEFHADYVQVGIVGKDVPHVHVHLIPRTLSDTSVPL